MNADDELKVRLGRSPRERGDFLGQALAAANRAGGMARGRGPGHGRFGRGGAASLAAGGPGRRSAVIKARVVRHGRGAPLRAHLRYLQRDGARADGEHGRLFDARTDQADGRDFAERCADDRHHFRFIVSPDDAEQLADLPAFTRELMVQAERDLGTRLDWVAAEHRNTAHPHIHVLVRGRADDGSDLVISRDYIREGVRARAGRLVELELGPRTVAEIRERRLRELEAARVTPLDRRLAARAIATRGELDMRPRSNEGPEASFERGRLAFLGRLGLAEPTAPGRWRLADNLLDRLEGLRREGDVIARLHAAMRGREKGVLAAETPDRLVGRLAGRGLDDELAGNAYAVVEGLDGKVHYLTLPDLDAATDAPVGAVVEWSPERGGRLFVRSDRDVQDQVAARGATWLDRRLLQDMEGVGEAGFGAEVQRAAERRRSWLEGEKLAWREEGRWRYAPGLLSRLRAAELGAAGETLAERAGRPIRRLAEGELVEGTYTRRLDLASGRFAVLEGAAGLAVVPWAPGLDRRLGQAVACDVGRDGKVAWRRGRGLER